MNDIMNLMRDYKEIINYAISEKYVQKRKSLRKFTLSKKSFVFMSQKQKSLLSEYILKISSSKIALFEKVLIKFMIVIFFLFYQLHFCIDFRKKLSFCFDDFRNCCCCFSKCNELNKYVNGIVSFLFSR